MTSTVFLFTENIIFSIFNCNGNNKINICVQIFPLLFHVTVFSLCFTGRKTGRHIMQVGALCFVVWPGNKHRCFELVKHILHGEGSSVGVYYTENTDPTKELSLSLHSISVQKGILTGLLVCCFLQYKVTVACPSVKVGPCPWLSNASKVRSKQFKLCSVLKENKCTGIHMQIIPISLKKVNT